MPEGWNPDQYLRFQAEREQPFWDLLALVRKKPGMRVCDLGCGTGALTAELHRELSARETIGVDSSAAMLSKAPQTPGLRFIEARIEDFDLGQFDLVFSNAALHWIPDHGILLERLTAALAPGGQLAFQIPSNDAHPSHETAFEVASEHHFKRHLSGPVHRAKVAEPSQYAGWLYHFGYGEQQDFKDASKQIAYASQGGLGLPEKDYYLRTGEKDVKLRADYVDRTRAAREVVPSEPVWKEFLERYRALLLSRLPDERPFPYPYPRILAWGMLPG